MRCNYYHCAEDAVPGRKQCELHLSLHSEAEYSRQLLAVEDGRCARCNARRVDARHCARHREWWNAYQRAYRRARRQQADALH